MYFILFLKVHAEVQTWTDSVPIYKESGYKLSVKDTVWMVFVEQSIE